MRPSVVAWGNAGIGQKASAREPNAGSSMLVPNVAMGRQGCFLTKYRTSAPCGASPGFAFSRPARRFGN